MSRRLESSRHAPAPRRACKSAFVQPQRGCGFRPRVDARRLPWVNGEGGASTPTGLRHGQRWRSQPRSEILGCPVRPGC
jgi:hypothetical protein